MKSSVSRLIESRAAEPVTISQPAVTRIFLLAGRRPAHPSLRRHPAIIKGAGLATRPWTTCEKGRRPISASTILQFHLFVCRSSISDCSADGRTAIPDVACPQFVTRISTGSNSRGSSLSTTEETKPFLIFRCRRRN